MRRRKRRERRRDRARADNGDTDVDGDNGETESGRRRPSCAARSRRSFGMPAEKSKDFGAADATPARAHGARAPRLIAVVALAVIERELAVLGPRSSATPPTSS